MNEDKITIGFAFRSAWEEDGWMVWGPDASSRAKAEAEGEDVRRYSRMKMILDLGGGRVWKEWLYGLDTLVNTRWNVRG